MTLIPAAYGTLLASTPAQTFSAFGNVVMSVLVAIGVAGVIIGVIGALRPQPRPVPVPVRSPRGNKKR